MSGVINNRLDTHGIDLPAIAAPVGNYAATVRSGSLLFISGQLPLRDGKPHYLQHIPRTWRLLEGDLAHPALAAVKDWFDREVPAEVRIVPAGEASS